MLKDPDFEAARQKLEEAKRIGIYGANWKIVEIGSYFVGCKDDLDAAKVTSEKIMLQCASLVSYLGGALAFNEFETIVVKPSIERPVAAVLGSLSMAAHPNFHIQTLFHEAGHLQFSQKQIGSLNEWLTAASLENPKLDTATTGKVNAPFRDSMTESFSDTLAILAQVRMGLLDQASFSTLMKAMHSGRASWKSDPNDRDHDTTKSLSLIEKIGFKALSTVPHESVAPLALAISTIGVMQKYDIPAPLPKLDLGKGVSAILDEAGVSLPQSSYPTCPKRGPTLADLMAMKPSPPAATAGPTSQVHGLSLDWSVVGPNAAKPFQPGLNPAWQRQREAVEVAPPDHQPRKLPTSP